MISRCLFVFDFHTAGSGSKESSCITSSGQTSLDVPNGVALLPRSPCGVHVLWNPVRYTMFINYSYIIKSTGAVWVVFISDVLFTGCYACCHTYIAVHVETYHLL